MWLVFSEESYLLYSYHAETNFLFIIITHFTLDMEPPKSISQKGNNRGAVA